MLVCDVWKHGPGQRGVGDGSTDAVDERLGERIRGAARHLLPVPVWRLLRGVAGLPLVIGKGRAPRFRRSHGSGARAHMFGLSAHYEGRTPTHASLEEITSDDGTRILKVVNKDTHVYAGIAGYRQQPTSDGSPGRCEERLPRDGAWRPLIINEQPKYAGHDEPGDARRRRERSPHQSLAEQGQQLHTGPSASFNDGGKTQHPTRWRASRPEGPPLPRTHRRTTVGSDTRAAAGRTTKGPRTGVLEWRH